MPESKGNREPDRKQCEGRGERRRLVAHQHPTDEGGIRCHGNGSRKHRAGLNGRIKLSIFMNSQTKRGERNRGGRTKESCEAFRAEDIAEDREDADDGASNEKT